MRTVKHLAFLLALGASATARAGGFLVYDVSAEASAKGSAVVASTDEPAAVWYNPAALSFVPGHRLSLGGSLIRSATSFEAAAGGTSDNVPATFALPHLFASFTISPRLSAGLGVYAVYGLGNEWKPDWIGRESSIRSALTTVSINPTLALRLSDQVSLGLGFDLLRGSVDMENALPEPVGGQVRIGGAGWGYGGNLGLLVRAVPDRLHVGLTYRSRIHLPLDGRVDFDPHPEFANSLPDQAGSSSATMPDILALGVLYKPIPSLEISLDLNLVLWGVYDETRIVLASGDEIAVEHDYHASGVLRAGVDWAAPVPGLHLRGGFIFDQTPAPAEHLDPSMPDSDQIDLTVGLGYAWRSLRADLAYQLLLYLPADSVTGEAGPEGTYRTTGHFLGLTVSATLDGPPRR
jgi:long-chain fatty acid transport protein